MDRVDGFVSRKPSTDGDAAGDHDPLHAFQPAGLKDIVGADDVAVQHALPRLGAGVGGQVRDHVHPAHGFTQALQVGQVAVMEPFCGNVKHPAPRHARRKGCRAIQRIDVVFVRLFLSRI